MKPMARTFAQPCTFCTVCTAQFELISQISNAMSINSLRQSGLPPCNFLSCLPGLSSLVIGFQYCVSFSPQRIIMQVHNSNLDSCLRMQYTAYFGHENEGIIAQPRQHKYWEITKIKALLSHASRQHKYYNNMVVVNQPEGFRQIKR